MVLKAIFGVMILAVLVIIAVVGIILNRKECRCSVSSTTKQVGDFTKGYITIYSVLILATGFILAKAGFFDY